VLRSHFLDLLVRKSLTEKSDMTRFGEKRLTTIMSLRGLP
jgi:hypothetical protein